MRPHPPVKPVPDPRRVARAPGKALDREHEGGGAPLPDPRRVARAPGKAPDREDEGGGALLSATRGLLCWWLAPPGCPILS